MSEIIYRQMTHEDIAGVVALQAACFPPPFPTDQLWQPKHLSRHLEIFPEGQLVAVQNDRIIGSASASRISEDRWLRHLPWEQTLGGYFFETFDPSGTTLYGADISVHPKHRKQGVGRGLYLSRFDIVSTLRLTRYGTACRIPGYAAWNKIHNESPRRYCEEVREGIVQDRTLSPLLKFGLHYLEVIEGYMEDIESANAAALLEWTPT